MFILDNYPCSLDAILFAYIDYILYFLGSEKLDSSSSSSNTDEKKESEGLEYVKNGRLKEILLEYDHLVAYHQRVKSKLSE